jgi:hypothetical protein
VTYFSVLVATGDPGRLAAALDAFDATVQVEPYRAYLEAADIRKAVKNGSPAGAAARASAGDGPDGLVATLSAYVGEEVRTEIIDGIPAYFYLCTRNREAELDGWRIGGRWSQHFKPRHSGDQGLIHGDAGFGGGVTADAESPFAGWVAGGRKSALDIEGTRDAAGVRAARLWDRFDGQRKQHAPALGWSSFLARSIAEPDAYPITQARADYHAQPLVAALAVDQQFLAPCPIDGYGIGRAACIQQERDRAIPGYALLTMDGEWVKPGNIGRFGTTSADDGSMAVYRDRVNAYVDGLPDDAWLIVAECHS